MPKIVANKPLGHRRLRRTRLHRRMSIDRTLGRVEARIRDAINSGLAVVIRNMLQKPVNRVIGIAGFVDIFGRLLVGLIRTNMNVLAFRPALPAHVLIDEDEALANKLLRRPKRCPVVVDSVRRNRVRCPGDQKRILLRRALRRVNRGEKPHAIPHRDEEFVFRVVRLDPESDLLGGPLFRRQRRWLRRYLRDSKGSGSERGNEDGLHKPFIVAG